MSGEEQSQAPVAKIVSTRERERKIPLEFEVEYDGKTYTEVTVRRVTGKEIEDYMEVLASSKERIVPPMIDCPLAVYEAMDDDDRFAIDTAMRDFLPRRLRVAAESGSVPHSGESTLD